MPGGTDEVFYDFLFDEQARGFLFAAVKVGDLRPADSVLEERAGDDVEPAAFAGNVAPKFVVFGIIVTILVVDAVLPEEVFADHRRRMDDEVSQCKRPIWLGYGTISFP